jgi:predicted transglutaminase-like cysteine proteinase
MATFVGCAATKGAFGERAFEAGAFMTTGGHALQPIDHYRFCQIHPSECVPTSWYAKRMRLAEVAWNVITDVNTTVNGRVLQVTDEDYYGEVES